MGAVHVSVSLPFLLELRCPYSRLRSIAITAWGMAAYTATTTVTSSNGCGANATRTIAEEWCWVLTIDGDARNKRPYRLFIPKRRRGLPNRPGIYPATRAWVDIIVLRYRNAPTLPDALLHNNNIIVLSAFSFFKIVCPISKLRPAELFKFIYSRKLKFEST